MVRSVLEDYELSISSSLTTAGLIHCNCSMSPGSKVLGSRIVGMGIGMEMGIRMRKGIRMEMEMSMGIRIGMGIKDEEGNKNEERDADGHREAEGEGNWHEDSSLHYSLLLASLLSISATLSDFTFALFFCLSEPARAALPHEPVPCSAEGAEGDEQAPKCGGHGAGEKHRTGFVQTCPARSLHS